MNKNIDEITRDLLKNSMVSLPDEDFTNRVMEIIQSESNEKQSFLSGISISWLFLVLSMILVPFTLPVLNRMHMSIELPDKMIVFSSILAIGILLIMNNLLKLTLRKN